MEGRAETDAQKYQIIKRVFHSWKKKPSLRLGQLISNSLTLHLLKGQKPTSPEEVEKLLFFVEDEQLVGILEESFGVSSDT